METEFTIYYDTQPNEVVDKIDSIISGFGLWIDSIEEGDGYIKYEIRGNTNTNNS